MFMEIRYAELLRRIGETAAAEHERDAIDAAPLLDRPVQHSRLIQLNAQLLADRARHDEALVELDKTPPAELLKVRDARLMQYGKFEEA